MSIQDLEKVSAQKMESLQRKQSREVQRLVDGHNALKEDIKKTNQEEIVDIQNENARRVAKESEKKEKVLSQMKGHLEETQKMTDKEIKELKAQADKIKNEEREKLAVQRELTSGEHEQYLEELNYRFDQSNKKMALNNKQRLHELIETNTEEMSRTKDDFQNRLQNKTAEFNERYAREARVQEQLKNQQDSHFKKERVQTNLRQQLELGKMTTHHNQHIEDRDNQFRKGLKEQDLMFEDKYAKTLQNHNENLERLTHRSDLVTNKLKDKLKEQLVMSVNKADDPFYSFTELKPSLKEYNDHVEVNVEVPDHAKKDLMLTINDKEVILNFSRRYDDTKKLDGVTNKLHKVESFTTRLATKHHLDPKSVKSSYEDGMMTYTIKRS